MADNRPPSLSFSQGATHVGAGHVWTDKDGDTQGQLRLSTHSDIVFHDPQQARDMAAELSKLAEAMAAEAARAAKEKVDG